jgi:DNA polymerase I
MQVISYDTETTSLNRRAGDVFSFSTCDYDGKSKVFRLDGSHLRQVQGRLALGKLWGDEGRGIAKVMHNAKFDLGFTEKLLGKKLTEHPFHDTMLMSHVLQNHHPGHGLKELCWELGGIPKDDEDAIKVYTRGGRSYQNVPEELMEKYQHRDAQRAMLLYRFFWPKLSAHKDWLEVYQNERDVIPVTLAMENRGVMLHVQRCKALIAKLEGDTRSVLDQIEAETGERFSPSSDKFRWYLYQKLRLPILQKTKSGIPSTDKEVLMELRKQHPLKIIDLALMYRSWSRGVSMLQSYLELADGEGVLHPNIRTCAAITGRESCSEPNLQNVEKTGVLLNPYPVPARTIFRPRPGYVNFHIDYSGQEMRLLVHYSGDEILVDTIRRGGDVHMPATLIFWGEMFKSLSKEEQKTKRTASKNTNFCISYGGAIAQAASTLGMDSTTFVARYRLYKATFPRLVTLMGEIVRQVKSCGYITTAFGRRLHVPKDQAYMGTNYLIQGTGAEMLKRAQVRVHQYLESATGGELKLLLPIHDELIIECPRARLKDAQDILRNVCQVMTDFGGRFKVPMGAEVSIATVDWAHKQDFLKYEAN